MSGPFINNVERYPVVIGRAGEGAEVYAGGARYLDFWGDEATAGLGYGWPIREALRDFAGLNVPHRVPDMFHNTYRTTFAERLCGLYGFDQVFFGNSGAEAIETAIKFVRKYQRARGHHQRRHCLTLQGNFHGRTYGALALSDSYGSGSPYHKEGYEPSVESHPWKGYGVIPDPPADCDDWDGWITANLPVPPEWVAGIFLAPVLGNNVVKGYNPEFIAALRRWCTDEGALLVFDEIQSGSGWTGHYSAAQMYGVQPDVMTLGKRMALGFPASATLFNLKVGKSIALGGHFNTFGGSPFIAFMGHRWLDWLELGGLQTITRNGQFLAEGLRRRSWVKEVNAYGMMMSFLPSYDGYDGAELAREAMHQGLLIVTHRPLGEIRFTPPCNTPHMQLVEGLTKLDDAYNRLMARKMGMK